MFHPCLARLVPEQYTSIKLVLLAASSNNVMTQVLDAPALADNFYASLLDWSQQGLLAVALGVELYVYNTVTCKASLQALYIFCTQSFKA